MPFGPMNGPVIFVIFIYDMDATWKGLATYRGIVIDAKTGTRIIVDDIFSWAPTFDDFIKYLTCQQQVCLSQNLSLYLWRNAYFVQRGWSLLGMMCVQIAIVQPSQSTFSWNPGLFLGLQEMLPHFWDSWTSMQLTSHSLRSMQRLSQGVGRAGHAT